MDLKIHESPNPNFHVQDYTYHDGSQVRVVLRVDERKMSRRLELDAEAFLMAGKHEIFLPAKDMGPTRSAVSTHVLALGEGSTWLNDALLRIGGQKANELIVTLGLAGDRQEIEPAADQESPDPA